MRSTIETAKVEISFSFTGKPRARASCFKLSTAIFEGSEQVSQSADG